METTALQMFTKTVLVDNDEDIFIKPLCDFFKIDPENQSDRIKNDPILSKSSAKKPSKRLFGDNYQRVCLNKKGFLRWIQIINPNIIDEQLRPSFLIYQELIFDFLIGSAEEQKMIGLLNAELQNMQLQYSDIGNRIRTTKKSLFAALNQRYQYSLPFSENTTTTALS